MFLSVCREVEAVKLSTGENWLAMLLGRRDAWLVVGVLIGVTAGLVRWSNRDVAVGVGTASMTRLAIVLIAMWLAWPSLRRPAAWLTPGITLAAVAMIVMVALQPRLIVVALPAIGFLFAFTAMVRFFRRGR